MREGRKKRERSWIEKGEGKGRKEREDRDGDVKRMENQRVGEMGGRGEKRKVRREERGMREERKEGGATEKWGERKGEGGEKREDGQKRKGTEGWVKGGQPGIVRRWRHGRGSTSPAPLRKCGNQHRARACCGMEVGGQTHSGSNTSGSGQTCTRRRLSIR